MFTKIDWMWSKAIETIFFHPLQTKTFRVVDITFAASLSIFCTLMSACCSMVKTSCVTQFKVTTCVGGSLLVQQFTCKWTHCTQCIPHPTQFPPLCAHCCWDRPGHLSHWRPLTALWITHQLTNLQSGRLLAAPAKTWPPSAAAHMAWTEWMIAVGSDLTER